MEQRSSFEQIMLGKKSHVHAKKERRKKSGKKTFHLHETELKINHLCDYRKSIYLKKKSKFFSGMRGLFTKAPIQEQGHG